jgi:hypothetical protein
MSTTLQRRIASDPRDAATGGWWDVARRVKDDVTADNLSMIATGAAFFGLPRALPGARRAD